LCSISILTINIERKTLTKIKSLREKYFLCLQSCEIWCLMSNRTKFNSTFYDCIQWSLENFDVIYDLYPTDIDHKYELCRYIFCPSIMDVHKIDLLNLIFECNFDGHHHIQYL